MLRHCRSVSISLKRPLFADGFVDPCENANCPALCYALSGIYSIIVYFMKGIIITE